MQIKQINKGFKEYKKVNFSAKKSAENVVYSPKRTKTDIVELTTKKTNQLWQEIKEYLATNVNVDHSQKYEVAIVCDLLEDDANLKNMIEDFKATFPYATRLFNIREFCENILLSKVKCIFSCFFYIKLCNTFKIKAV